ncbi:hypothetical protein [Demequina sp. NBRC 110052]|uniref:hypothetical protein n=1 Tax=Demequina sp. NBRC 110052 TaxID=1570341 RepID=UPI000A07A38A|nr:hypothetical protein [Demequina sp. NBRC 110052]
MTTSALPRRMPLSRSAVIGAVAAILGLFPLAIGFSTVGLMQVRDDYYRGRGFAVFGLAFTALTWLPIVWWYFFAR